MTFKSFCFMVRTSDISRMVNFYSEAFGFKQEFRWPEDPAELVELTTLILDGRRLRLALLGDPSPGLRPDVSGKPVSRALCLKTDNVDAEVSRLRASGVPILYEPTDQPCGERMAYVADPDGHLISLSSDPKP